jgi:hypothetical protein
MRVMRQNYEYEGYVMRVIEVIDEGFGSEGDEGC